MTGQEAIELIHQRAWTGRKPGLERTQALLASLGNPERRLRFVHITGTNGKGSTAAMTASILAQAGLRAGLFTSPHLYRFHERMQVNGAPIPDEVLGRLTQQVLEVAEGMSDPPTEFELMTAVGMEFFLEEQCDIVVLEVGLGGRLDSTNVIPAPEAAVITNIGLEHTQELGGTLTLIAREKSGILKPGCRAVLYRQSDEVTQVIQSVCRQLDIPLRQTDPQELEVLSSGLEGQDFRYRGRGPYRLSLLGSYQLSNAITALEVVQALRDAGWTIPEEAAARGLAAAQWPGRLELARRSPDFIVDGGHNPQCVDALAAALESLYPGRKLIFLFGPLWALAVGAVSDLIGATLFPFGAFFPGFTVTAGLVGLIYGLFLHQKGEGFHGRALWLRVVGASLCASLTRLVLNSVWLYIMYGKGLFGMLPARFTETICMVAAQILLIPVLLSLSRQLTRRGAFPA